MKRKETIFDQNMIAWKEKFSGGQDEIRRKYELLEGGSVETDCVVSAWASQDDRMIFQIERDGRDVFLGGKRNCLGPIKSWLKGYGELEPATTLFLIGLGNPYYFKQACKELDEQIRILVYEPSLTVFLSVMEQFDLTQELKSDRTIIFLVDGINDELINDTVCRLIHVNMLPYLKVYTIPNYKELFTEKIKKFTQAVFHECDRCRIGLNTNIKFSGVMAKNLLRNIRYVADGITTKQFCEYIPRDIPAIIVAAGPSLDKNIKELKRAKGKAFIIAVDTAMKPLLREGIIPDMFVIVDGVKPLRLIQDPKAQEIPMLGSISSSYEVFEYHTGRKVFYEEYYSIVDSMFEKTGVEFETVPTGGSVATSAFAFAYMIGMETIILVGQDLAMQGTKTHAAGTIEDKIDFEKQILVEGNYEDQVATRSDFKVYLDWYNWYIQGVLDTGVKLRVINATEGGAKIKNTEIMTLREAIDSTCTKEVDVEGLIRQIPDAFNEEQKEWIRGYLEGIPGQFREIQKLAISLKRLYQKLDEICSKQKLNQDVYLKTLKKIKKLTKQVEDHEECMHVISETLKVADFILKSEQNLKQQEPKKEGKEIARQGLIYTDLLNECAGLFSEYSKEIFEKEKE